MTALLFAARNWKLLGLGFLCLVIAGLIAVNVVQGKRLDKMRTQLAAESAARELCQASIDELKADGDRREKAAQDALRAQRKANEAARATAEKLRAYARSHEPSGQCATPSLVLEAEL